MVELDFEKGKGLLACRCPGVSNRQGFLAGILNPPVGKNLETGEAITGVVTRRIGTREAPPGTFRKSKRLLDCATHVLQVEQVGGRLPLRYETVFTAGRRDRGSPFGGEISIRSVYKK